MKRLLLSITLVMLTTSAYAQTSVQVVGTPGEVQQSKSKQIQQLMQQNQQQFQQVSQRMYTSGDYSKLELMRLNCEIERLIGTNIHLTIEQKYQEIVELNQKTNNLYKELFSN